MKPFALALLALVLAMGFYLNKMDPDKDSAQVMIEDSVESSMAAPQK